MTPVGDREGQSRSLTGQEPSFCSWPSVFQKAGVRRGQTASAVGPPFWLPPRLAIGASNSFRDQLLSRLTRMYVT